MAKSSLEMKNKVLPSSILEYYAGISHNNGLENPKKQILQSAPDAKSRDAKLKRGDRTENGVAVQ